MSKLLISCFLAITPLVVMDSAGANIQEEWKKTVNKRQVIEQQIVAYEQKREKQENNLDSKMDTYEECIKGFQQEKQNETERYKKQAERNKEELNYMRSHINKENSQLERKRRSIELKRKKDYSRAKYEGSMRMLMASYDVYFDTIRTLLFGRYDLYLNNIRLRIGFIDQSCGQAQAKM